MQFQHVLWPDFSLYDLAWAILRYQSSLSHLSSARASHELAARRLEEREMERAGTAGREGGGEGGIRRMGVHQEGMEDVGAGGQRQRQEAFVEALGAKRREFHYKFAPGHQRLREGKGESESGSACPRCNVPDTTHPRVPALPGPGRRPGVGTKPSVVHGTPSLGGGVAGRGGGVYGGSGGAGGHGRGSVRKGGGFFFQPWVLHWGVGGEGVSKRIACVCVERGVVACVVVLLCLAFRS